MIAKEITNLIAGTNQLIIFIPIPAIGQAFHN
jgi:hypothetical protein